MTVGGAAPGGYRCDLHPGEAGWWWTLSYRVPGEDRDVVVAHGKTRTRRGARRKARRARRRREGG